MGRVRLVSWKPEEAERQAALLTSLGHDVDASPVESGTIRALPFARADVFVIDLDRLPSQGRDVGITLRRAKSSRHVPLVFAGGSPDKVGRVRGLLPDASYAGWDDIGDAIADARSPTDPVVPDSNLAGYATTPLPQKLGLKPGTTICLVQAPRDFALADLPEGATVKRRGERDLTMAWVRTPAEAGAMWDRLASDELVDDVWIVWAKKASAQYAGVTQAHVREPGMARGFVDFKVCAIDATWTGLRFKRRR